MERIIVRDHIKDLIGNRKVLAALFHTFNFEPRFFENYVMPLFVPEKNFRDEIIHNKILWRHCAKEGIIPPVSVFCDYYAKDNTEAPSLAYDIHCIKLPASKGCITNFHPKHILILVEDDRQSQSLLFITGSGNLTANGWCDNHECFAFHEIKKTKIFPNKSTTNILQDYITEVGKLAGLKSFLPSEELIHLFLSYVDLKIPLFNSLQQSFQQFIEDNIFNRYEIIEVEIVSPYFSNDLILINYLKQKGIKTVKCLIPFLRSNEIQLEKETFGSLEKAGLIWGFWNDNKVMKEIRNQHSKIYRFYSKDKCFTVIGSVNFTNPAWALFSKKNNKANIESGVLYQEGSNVLRLLKPANLDMDQVTFIVKEDLENPLETSLFERKAPDLDFTIDWKNKTLLINANLGEMECRFDDLLNKKQISNSKAVEFLDAHAIRQLSKSCLIKVAVETGANLHIYTYYPNQLNVETKPLGFKVDANIIMKYWQFLDNDIEIAKITRALAEQGTDESGVYDDKKIEKKSLLNDMAAHFSSLTILEKFLFNEGLKTKKERIHQFANLQYYLLSENIDTVPFYINDIKLQSEQKNVQASFYWMVLQILCNSFYAQAEKWTFRNDIDPTSWKEFKKDIKSKNVELSSGASTLIDHIPGLKGKEKWIIDQLVAV